MTDGEHRAAGPATPSTLRQIEEALLATITAAPGGAPDRARRPLPAGLVVGDQRLDAQGRVAIYADMYFARLLDVLREDYPKLAAQLGEPRFRELTARFVAAVAPPPALRHLGRRLPTFLEGAEAQGLPGWRAWLPDLARLEWARADVFDRRDVRPLALDEVQAQAAQPGGLDHLPLRGVPALDLVPVAFAVEERWRALERGDELPAAVPAAPGRLLVWRRGGEVVHRRAVPEEVGLLPLLIEGTTFAVVADRLGEGRSIEEAARLSFVLVGGWIAAGLVMANPAGEGTR
jgi:hypothetical protein